MGDDERDSRWQARCGAHRARRTPHPSLQATVAALDEAGTPRFDAVVCKRQDIKAGMGHSPDKLHEYPQVLGEIVEAMGARA